MKTLELFSGTKSFSRVAAKLGHQTLTIDNNASLNPDICCDILSIPLSNLPTGNDIIWASPPCTAFSVASIGTHWAGGSRAYIPKTDSARIGIKLVERTIWLIEVLKPKWWFIENPRGVLRKMPFMQNFKRVTVTYCQYGDERMKPTDIWTNAYWWEPKSLCKNGDPCHVKAPRGSKTGTQGLKGAMERGAIPPNLFIEIFEQIPKQFSLMEKGKENK